MDIAFPEPEQDLRAQITALLCGKKPAVFVAATNGVPVMELAPDIFTVRRPEGTLFTRNTSIALAFRFQKTITNEDMARWLNYPECKSDKTDRVIQVRDDSGNVMVECATSNPETTAKHFADYGGNVVQLSVGEALRRRRELINGTV